MHIVLEEEIQGTAADPRAIRQRIKALWVNNVKPQYYDPLVASKTIQLAQWCLGKTTPPPRIHFLIDKLKGFCRLALFWVPEMKKNKQKKKHCDLITWRFREISSPNNENSVITDLFSCRSWLLTSLKHKWRYFWLNLR